VTDTDHEHDRDTSRLRIRLWIDGELRDETWIDAADPFALLAADFARRAHEVLVAAADRDGIPWLTEVYDPSAPEDRAYFRVGSDHDGMVYPVPINGASS
jgi:hypothetical protein